jgi:hypothetical protein
MQPYVHYVRMDIFWILDTIVSLDVQTPSMGIMGLTLVMPVPHRVLTVLM